MESWCECSFKAFQTKQRDKAADEEDAFDNL